MWLLGIPLVCQLVFGAVLISSLIQVDAAAHKDAETRQIISLLQDIRYTIVKYMSILTARTLYDAKRVVAARKEIDTEVAKELAALEPLVSRDKGVVQVYRRYKENLIKFRNLTNEIGISLEEESPKIYVTTFLNESDFGEELLLLFKQVVDDEQFLIARFRPVQQEFSPESFQQREKLRNFIILIAASYSGVFVIFAVWFGRKALRRLDVLMKNIELFSDGATDLEPLEGNDELSDVDTRFKQMAKARWQAEELRRSLFAAVSHDLRSPLTSVSLTLELLLLTDREKLQATTLEKLNKTKSEVLRLGRLADSLLEIEKIETGHIELNKEETSIEEIVENAHQAVFGLADSKQISVDIKFEPDDVLTCDSDRIVQILVNLLSNAVKFSPRDSVIKLRVILTPSHARFEVVDSGPGVTPEDQSRLFQKFSQVTKDKQLKKIGSGLGLYIARMLVEAHDGVISYSVTDEGSTFIFEIPN